MADELYDLITGGPVPEWATQMMDRRPMTNNTTALDAPAMGVKLLPCPNPWCQHPDTRSLVFWKRDGYRVYCDCSVATPRFQDANDAIAAWNTRAATLAPVDQVDRARVEGYEAGIERCKAMEAALRPFAEAAKWWAAFHDFQRITSLHQHGDCLEVRHLRDAVAALKDTPEHAR